MKFLWVYTAYGTAWTSTGWSWPLLTKHLLDCYVNDIIYSDHVTVTFYICLPCAMCCVYRYRGRRWCLSCHRPSWRVRLFISLAYKPGYSIFYNKSVTNIFFLAKQTEGPFGASSGCMHAPLQREIKKLMRESFVKDRARLPIY